MKLAKYAISDSELIIYTPLYVICVYVTPFHQHTNKYKTSNPVDITKTLYSTEWWCITNKCRVISTTILVLYYFSVTVNTQKLNENTVKQHYTYL